jgi:hypothetical protein
LGRHEQVIIDVPLWARRRDAAAARRFFRRALLRPMRGLRTDHTAQVIIAGESACSLAMLKNIGRYKVDIKEAGKVSGLRAVAG